MRDFRHESGMVTDAKKLAGLALCALLSAIPPAHANDTTATLSAGGLEITASTDIAMEREELYLSTKDVQVSYLFRNMSTADIETRVAFPMPEVPFGPIDNVVLPQPGKDNFVGFTVKADGEQIRPELHVRALSAPVDEDSAKPAFPQGMDMTEAVLRAGLPVNAGSESWKTTLSAMPEAKRKALVSEGLLYDGDASPDGWSPQWSMRETYHWQQTFPAGKAVKVEHHYRPVSGMSFFTGDAPDMETISATFGKRYCLDQNGLAGVRRLLDKARSASAAGKDGTYVFATETEYVLRTGANWKGPIGDFRMTIDKLFPDAVLTTCADGIVKTGPTTFTVERTHFTPEHDVRFVVFRFGEPG
ncbi:DUF4424 family protein [Aquamicrobium defluvii]|uniref:DUF4424 domain-containing protein n=1 Tax=Aquamicrobium defluvii TaxID=69279 RepID=A0A011SWU9_9HYPH|nr:DUF4424 family protein [Aquamicrobium defluvii]EXL03739.1 hypothetical protein BG36_11565 [Aquamicrobium defluvii]EZQ15288.1 hypothetical protein CF98_12635 [Halopseudomonas bauzanensis]